jgi:hypothetical protein
MSAAAGAAGKRIQRKSRRSIRLGSYNHITTEIRIHPSLNAHNIPAYFIQSIIHHEYLHYLLGPNHNRRFHSHERKFRYYRESKEWIRRNLFLPGTPRAADGRDRARADAADGAFQTAA